MLKKVILVTAFADRLRDEVKDELLARNVDIVKKEFGYTDKIINICDDLFSAEVAAIAKQTEAYAQSLLENDNTGKKIEKDSPYENLIKRTKIRLTNYINNLPNRRYSAILC